MIELRGLTKRYGGVVAVEELSLEVARGECRVLLGSSGCGKTTTLKMVNRLVEPTAGAVRLAGRDTRALPPHELRRRVGYVFQQVGLFPHLTVRENVGITPELLGWAPSGSAGAWTPSSSSWSSRRPTSATASPTPSPAASSSAWASRARSRPSRRRCSSTSPSARSTP